MNSEEADLGFSQAGGSEQGEAEQEGTNVSDNPLAAAVSRYRQLVASMPGLVPELVQGDTIEAIDASAEKARHTYSEITRRIAEQYEREVPTGNPSRSSNAAAYSNLKPEAKIALGLKTSKK